LTNKKHIGGPKWQTKNTFEDQTNKRHIWWPKWLTKETLEAVFSFFNLDTSVTKMTVYTA